MKSLKYLAIAAAVAGVAITSSPADAGSVGAKGGSVKENPHYNVTRSSETVNIDKSTTSSKTEKKYGDRSSDQVEYTKKNGADDIRDGDTSYKVTVKAVHDIFITKKSQQAATQTCDTFTFDNKSQAKNASNIKDMLYNAVQTGRNGWNLKNPKYTTCAKLDSSSSGAMNNFCVNLGATNCLKTNAGTLAWLNESKYKNAVDNAKKQNGKLRSTGKYSETEVSRVEKEKDTGKREYDTKDNTTITTTSEDTITDTFKSKKYVYNDGSSILIGDADNFDNAYVAQGQAVVDTEYDRHIHTTTTNTKTGDVTNVTYEIYSKYDLVTKQKHEIKYQDYVYKVDMNVSVTPIVLDLDGDGKIEASNGKYMPHEGDFSKNVVMFDFYGNGFPVAMEWVGTNDGLLCRPEADGTVKGTNLFGSANGYANGYDELASLDANRDGVLTGAELDGLMVWQDENHNGVADKGELKNLESLGISSIGVTNNNLTGTYTRNGKNYKSFDWNPSVLKLRQIDVAH
jgi:hypothetical protein